MYRIGFIIFFISLTTFAQKKKSTKIGQTTVDELEMTVYDKDTLTNAVVLYEHANVYIDASSDYKFRTDYYYRVKLLNSDGYYRANIQIPLYKNETIKDIKAITYNLKGTFAAKTFLQKDAIFTTELDEYWSETRFTLPNLKEGAVIEYVYSVISPNPRLDDWYFQEEIPKLNSEYDAVILGNFRYRARLIGFKGLDKDEPSVKRNCIYIPRVGDGDCTVYSYGMTDVPAFEEEDYMLSSKNYKSRLILDLISFTDTRGSSEKYTKTWKDVDKTLRIDFLDKQTEKTKFFKNNLPSTLLTITDNLEKAKQVYQYIQNKLFWNGKYWTREKLKVKNIYEEGSGSVDAINLILHNSLKASGIESYLVASSTRKHGLPTKLYPIIKDFNYLLVKVVIGDKTYFLDATDKNLAFGQVPFRCLNGEGRVLDFKNGGYWEAITTVGKSAAYVNAILTLNDTNNFEGELNITNSGYFGLKTRKNLINKSIEAYRNDFESNYPDISVEDLVIKNRDSLDKPLIQNLKISIDADAGDDADFFSFNPFIYNKIEKNPFKLKERKFAIDYGYPNTYIYNITFNIPETFEIAEVPENKSLALPNNKGGSYTVNVFKDNNTIKISARFSIRRSVFPSENYQSLKTLYNNIIKSQNDIILLKRK